jgi:hypothetical protein
MKQTITKSDFRDAFKKMGRDSNFSYDGLGALFDYLELLETETREELELDVIAICCDFSEYENLAEFQNDYPDYETMEDIENETTVIKVDDERFIIQQF